ncbi:hypothetical protein SUGI_1176520 [Cryptomeria japonica]|nr:hypothetical protein SUGI_1176520 [Cryptomeria japonica]
MEMLTNIHHLLVGWTFIILNFPFTFPRFVHPIPSIRFRLGVVLALPSVCIVYPRGIYWFSIPGTGILCCQEVFTSKAVDLCQRGRGLP